MGFIRLVNASFHDQDSDSLVFEHLNLEINTNWRGGIVVRNRNIFHVLNREFHATHLLKIVYGYYLYQS